MKKIFTITEVKVTTPIELTGDERLTFVAIGTGGTDYVLDAQVKVHPEGEWVDAQAAMTDSEVYATVSGVSAFRFNLSDMGAATSVQAEVRGLKI